MLEQLSATSAGEKREAVHRRDDRGAREGARRDRGAAERRSGAGLADRVHDRRLQHRPARPRAGAGRRDRHDRHRAFRPRRAAGVGRNRARRAGAGARRRRGARGDRRPGNREDPVARGVARDLDNGVVLDVHALGGADGLPIVVDGAQSVGAIDVDVGAIDYYTVSGQKWLCGPESTGALYIADADALRVARPGYFAQQSSSPAAGTSRARAAAVRSRLDPGRVAEGIATALGLAPSGGSSGSQRPRRAAAKRLRNAFVS